jgi:hypothetical protein
MDIFVDAQAKNLKQFLDDCAVKIRNGEERPIKDVNTHAVTASFSKKKFLVNLIFSYLHAETSFYF